MFKNILTAVVLVMALNVEAYAQRIQSTYVDAEVVSVRPVFSQSRCYSSNTYQPQYEQAPRSRTAPILGGIVGAAIGNQVGGGSGRDAATVAGAVLGYNITRDSQERSRYNERQYGQHRNRSYEERCEQRVESYDVIFYFNGREYQTRALYNPGPTIRLRVDFSVEQ